MSKYEELFKDFVNRFSYKPNVKFIVKCDMNRFCLYLDYHTNDSLIHNESVTISHYNSLFKQEFIDVYSKNFNLFKNWIKHCVYKMEMHEMNEFFRCDGLQLINPHQDEITDLTNLNKKNLVLL